MRTNDEDWVKKCMDMRVVGIKPVRRPRRAWLENVEGNIVELEIDRECVYDRRKWRKNVM